MRHGFLLMDKPVGPTSHDVVAIVRRTLGERAVGHLGTLDPLASGLMVLAVGAKALKVLELFSGLEKEYVADITFGAVSDTYDAHGTLEITAPKPGWGPPEQAVLQRHIDERFVGRIAQVPPAHSAVHVGGERAYRKARRGDNVTLAARTVEIASCTVVRYAFPSLTLAVRCGAGTYIRSLAHDLGEVLRCGGYLSGLRRTAVGAWRVEHAVTPACAAWANVLPLKDILKDLPKVQISSQDYEALRHGKDLPLEVKPNVIAWCDGLPVAILTPKKDGSRQAHPRKVL